MALFTHGSGSSNFITLMKAFGTANIAEPAYAQCKVQEMKPSMLHSGRRSLS